MNDYLSMSQAAKQVPGRVTPSSVWRWCRKGVKARNGQTVKLQHERVGGRVYTKAVWMQEFFASTAAADAEYFDAPTPIQEHRWS